MVDSGSVKTFINKNTAKKLKLFIIPKNKTIALAASNQHAKITGEAVVDLILKDKTHSGISIEIIENLFIDLIIGKDILKEYKKVTLKFDGPRDNLIIGAINKNNIFPTINVPPPPLFSNLSPHTTPIAMKSRRYTFAANKFIKEETARMLKEGIIEPSISPWRVQVLVTSNENHKKRMVVDYSDTINRFTELDAYPIPNINKMVDDIAQYNVFSTLDLKSAYHQIPINHTDRKFTAFEIRDQRYAEAARQLNHQLETHPKSRAALSLLGYCNFQLQNFVEAADCYEQLSILHPEVDDYKLYYAQSLYKACFYQEAMKVACQIENPEYQTKITKLQAAIKYGEDDLSGAKGLVDQCPPTDPDTELNQACILFKENHYEEACKKFVTALQITGYKAETCYNIAVCFYMIKQYSASLKYINEIIEKGVQDYPDLDVGMTTMGLDTRSVGNSLLLQETGLVQAFNLKAAIEYQLKNLKAAREALTDMPPRAEEELDVVTLHNQALINMDNDPTQGFGKLQFLMQQTVFPPETFANLLILYVKYEYFDLAADVLAENAHLTYKYLTPELYDFLEAVITRQTAPEDAYRRLDEMATRKTETLRKLTKQVQQSKQINDEEALKRAVNEYDDALETYIPILMQQARIYWDKENYNQVEKIFQTSLEFCNDHDIWKLNVAHVLFMQEKYKDATGFYEAIVKKNYDRLQDISAIVLANLCVSYIMTNQNEEAEAVMRKIEQEEEALSHNEPDKKVYHLCIVNMVIGTLYCAKGNYEFGISRVIKSLEPYQKKLVTDTWFYAKRCFLSLIENMTKHMIMIRDSVVQECIMFLDHCETYGQDVKAVTEQPLEEEPMNPGKNCVSYEARVLKSLLMQLV